MADFPIEFEEESLCHAPRLAGIDAITAFPSYTHVHYMPHATYFHLDRVLCTSEKLSKLRCLRVRSSDMVRLNGISRITFSALLTFDFRGLFLLLHLTRWLFVPLERNPHTLLLIYTDGTLTLQSAYGPICPPLCPAASHGWKRLF